MRKSRTFGKKWTLMKGIWSTSKAISPKPTARSRTWTSSSKDSRRLTLSRKCSISLRLMSLERSQDSDWEGFLLWMSSGMKLMQLWGRACISWWSWLTDSITGLRNSTFHWQEATQRSLWRQTPSRSLNCTCLLMRTGSTKEWSTCWRAWTLWPTMWVRATPTLRTPSNTSLSSRSKMTWFLESQ